MDTFSGSMANYQKNICVFKTLDDRHNVSDEWFKEVEKITWRVKKKDSERIELNWETFHIARNTDHGLTASRASQTQKSGWTEERRQTGREKTIRAHHPPYTQKLSI